MTTYSFVPDVKVAGATYSLALHLYRDVPVVLEEKYKRKHFNMYSYFGAYIPAKTRL